MATRHVITVDLEELFHGLDFPVDYWGHYESRIEHNTGALLEVSGQYDVKATSSVLSEVARQWPRVVRAVHNAGHKVTSRGFVHIPCFLQTDVAIHSVITASVSVLADLPGKTGTCQ